MSPLNPELFRKPLEEERERVRSAIEGLREDHPGSLETETDEIGSDNHPADLATATLDRELDYTLEGNSESLLAAIDAALARIQAGTFGHCSRCDAEIPQERLEALPYATLCIECKRREEA